MNIQDSENPSMIETAIEKKDEVTALLPTNSSELPPKPCFYIPYRFIIATLLGISHLLFYMHRTSMSIAIIPMAEEFNWDRFFFFVLHF